MTPREQYELLKIIGGLFNRTLEQETASQFAQQLAEDVEARTLYANLVALNVDLEWSCNTHSQRDLFAAGAGISIPRETSHRSSGRSAAPAKFSLPRFRFGDHKYSIFSQPVLWCAALVGLCLYGSFVLIAWNLRPDKLLSNSESVAVVRDTTDVRWPKNASSKPAKSAILLAEPLKISSGTIELELTAGTKLVVEGPADWSVDGVNSVSLRAGKLLARVPENAIGFTVETPTAKIVDLGTEFGVEVSESGATDVHVVRGAVEVDRSPSASTASTLPVKKRLVAGQTIRVGHASMGDVLAASNAKSTLSGAATAVAALDLVDIVAGGDGRGHRRDRGIDFATGRIVFVPDKNFDLFRVFPSGSYRRPDDRPFIDGVSIPDSSRGPVQLDSAGHTFAGFPKTSGGTYGPLWAGGTIPDSPNSAKFRTTFDGKLDYSKLPHGLITLIPNKIITFDLTALRRAHRGHSLTKFRTVAGLSKPDPIPPGYQEGDGLADVWVFIDGELQLSRLGIRSADDPFTIELPLSSTTQFLTFATTDGGNTAGFDWVFLGDPRIELEVKEQK